MISKYFFNLNSIAPQKNDASGRSTYVTSKEVPGFVNISFAVLKLNPRGFQEPIWHPNANKIGYCSQGKVLVAIRTPESAETFVVEEGDIFFIPQGYVHHIENIGQTESILHFAMNNTLPESMTLSNAVRSLTDSVFTSTFNTSTGFVKGLKEVIDQDVLKTLPPLKDPPSSIFSRFKFDLARSVKPILTSGGYLQVGTKKNLPILEGLGILRFGLNPKGAVEPHWHTNAGELVYIVKGHTRITILAPDGSVEMLEVKGGEGVFAPASHFHNIENIGADEVEVIAFFNHANPDYIGIGEVVGSYDNAILASLFNVAANYFDPLKKTAEPLVIVPIK